MLTRESLAIISPSGTLLPELNRFYWFDVSRTFKMLRLNTGFEGITINLLQTRKNPAVGGNEFL